MEDIFISGILYCVDGFEFLSRTVNFQLFARGSWENGRSPGKWQQYVMCSPFDVGPNLCDGRIVGSGCL